MSFMLKKSLNSLSFQLSRQITQQNIISKKEKTCLTEKNSKEPEKTLLALTKFSWMKISLSLVLGSFTLLSFWSLKKKKKYEEELCKIRTENELYKQFFDPTSNSSDSVVKKFEILVQESVGKGKQKSFLEVVELLKQTIKEVHSSIRDQQTH